MKLIIDKQIKKQSDSLVILISKEKEKVTALPFQVAVANTEVTGIAWPSAEDNPDRKGTDVMAYTNKD